MQYFRGRESNGCTEKRGYETAFRPSSDARIPGGEYNHRCWSSGRKRTGRDDGAHRDGRGFDSGEKDRQEHPAPDAGTAVSYTNMTLPTNREVEVSVAAASITN